MKILSRKQMAEWDRLTIQGHGLSGYALMERAAHECCRVLTEAPRWVYQARVLIVCGPGNNGGDGFAMAVQLRRQGVKVTLYFLGEAERLSEAAGAWYAQAGPVRTLRAEADWRRFAKDAKQADYLVDALFGIGLSRPLGGKFRRAIEVLNASRGHRLAVDMPSGIDADSGKVLGIAFRADTTVTFEAPKWGQIQPESWDYVGDLRVEPIGLAASELRRFSARAEWLTADMVRPWLKRRSRGTHKGDAGKVLVIAGSESMPGAGYLSALAALRSGAGLVSWALPEEAFHKIDLNYPEIILHPLPSRDGRFCLESLAPLAKVLPHFQSIAIGPGLGDSPQVREFLEKLIAKVRKPIVLDADALNALATLRRLPAKIKNSIWTPHPKEMARLSGQPVRTILANRIETARRWAKRRQIWLLLKGYRSVIASPQGEIWINSSGGPNLATAGSGDVLTGIIAGLLAQGMARREALLTGVFLHGMAGDRLAQSMGDRGTLASDIARMLPEALEKLS